MTVKIIKKGQRIRKLKFLKYSWLMFGNGCVKTVFDFKVKISSIVLFFGGSKAFVEITQNIWKMKNMAFETKVFYFSFFSKHFYDLNKLCIFSLFNGL
jgi:hypothetical protein